MGEKDKRKKKDKKKHHHPYDPRRSANERYVMNPGHMNRFPQIQYMPMQQPAKSNPLQLAIASGQFISGMDKELAQNVDLAQDQAIADAKARAHAKKMGQTLEGLKTEEESLADVRRAMEGADKETRVVFLNRLTNRFKQDEADWMREAKLNDEVGRAQYMADRARRDFLQTQAIHQHVNDKEHFERQSEHLKHTIDQTRLLSEAQRAKHQAERAHENLKVSDKIMRRTTNLTASKEQLEEQQRDFKQEEELRVLRRDRKRAKAEYRRTENELYPKVEKLRSSKEKLEDQQRVQKDTSELHALTRGITKTEAEQTQFDKTNPKTADLRIAKEKLEDAQTGVKHVRELQDLDTSIRRSYQSYDETKVKFETQQDLEEAKERLWQAETRFKEFKDIVDARAKLNVSAAAQLKLQTDVFTTKQLAAAEASTRRLQQEVDAVNDWNTSEKKYGAAASERIKTMQKLDDMTREAAEHAVEQIANHGSKYDVHVYEDPLLHFDRDAQGYEFGTAEPMFEDAARQRLMDRTSMDFGGPLAAVIPAGHYPVPHYEVADRPEPPAPRPRADPFPDDLPARPGPLPKPFITRDQNPPPPVVTKHMPPPHSPPRPETKARLDWNAARDIPQPEPPKSKAQLETEAQIRILERGLVDFREDSYERKSRILYIERLKTSLDPNWKDKQNKPEQLTPVETILAGQMGKKGMTPEARGLVAKAIDDGHEVLAALKPQTPEWIEHKAYVDRLEKLEQHNIAPYPQDLVPPAGPKQKPRPYSPPPPPIKPQPKPLNDPSAIKDELSEDRRKEYKEWDIDAGPPVYFIKNDREWRLRRHERNVEEMKTFVEQDKPVKYPELIDLLPPIDADKALYQSIQRVRALHKEDPVKALDLVTLLSKRRTELLKQNIRVADADWDEIQARIDEGKQDEAAMGVAREMQDQLLDRKHYLQSYLTDHEVVKAIDHPTLPFIRASGHIAAIHRIELRQQKGYHVGEMDDAWERILKKDPTIEESGLSPGEVKQHYMDLTQTMGKHSKRMVERRAYRNAITDPKNPNSYFVVPNKLYYAKETDDGDSSDMQSDDEEQARRDYNWSRGRPEEINSSDEDLLEDEGVGE
jgi:hypothetical protein